MVRFILGIIFGGLIILFMVQNAEPAQITFLFWTFTLSRAIMYLIMAVLGFGSGFLIMTIRKLKKKRKKKAEEEEEKEEEDE